MSFTTTKKICLQTITLLFPFLLHTHIVTSAAHTDPGDTSVRVTISSCLQYSKDNCFVQCHNRIPHLLPLQEANVADIFASFEFKKCMQRPFEDICLYLFVQWRRNRSGRSGFGHYTF